MCLYISIYKVINVHSLGKELYKDRDREKCQMQNKTKTNNTEIQERE